MKVPNMEVAIRVVLTPPPPLPFPPTLNLVPRISPWFTHPRICFKNNRSNEANW